MYKPSNKLELLPLKENNINTLLKFCQTNKNLLDKIKNENASLLEIKEFENNYKLIELCIYQLARGHYKYGLGNTPILVLKIYIALLTILAIGIFMLAFKK